MRQSYGQSIEECPYEKALRNTVQEMWIYVRETPDLVTGRFSVEVSLDKDMAPSFAFTLERFGEVHLVSWKMSFINEYGVQTMVSRGDNDVRLRPATDNAPAPLYFSKESLPPFTNLIAPQAIHIFRL